MVLQQRIYDNELFTSSFIQVTESSPDETVVAIFASLNKNSGVPPFFSEFTWFEITSSQAVSGNSTKTFTVDEPWMWILVEMDVANPDTTKLIIRGLNNVR